MNFLEHYFTFGENSSIVNDRYDVDLDNIK